MLDILRGMTYEERSRCFSGISMFANFAWAAAKVVAGVFLASGHLMVGGLYSFVLGFAKLTYFSSLSRSVSERPHFAIGMGALITLSGALYAVYMAGMLAFPRRFDYGRDLSILIALSSFIEFGFSVRGVMLTRKVGDEMFACLKCVNLAASLPAIVLTQIALTTYVSETDFNLHNALFGIIMGGIAMLIGAYVVVKGLTYAGRHKLL